MTKDEALDLALEALEHMLEDAKQERITVEYWNECVDAITAIKQARALDKMAENARELGLDYEPLREDWGPGPHEVHSLPAQPAPVQEPVGEVCGYYERGFDAEKTRYGKLYNQDLPLGIKLYTTPPAAQRQWVGLTDEQTMAGYKLACSYGVYESKAFDLTEKMFLIFKEKNT